MIIEAIIIAIPLVFIAMALERIGKKNEII